MMTEEQISKLESVGFRRWTKGNMDRLYINASCLGLELEYYKTGNIRTACFNGYAISNSEGYRLKGAKTFIDVKTGAVHSDREELQAEAQKLMDKAIKEVMA